MAIIHFHDGKQQSVKPEVGAAIWLVLTGEQEPTPDQEKFASRVKNVCLNWRNAPDSYIKKKFHHVVGFALADWTVNRAGKPTHPSSEFGWTFAKRWGLWDRGRPSEIVTHGKVPLL
jgi:hypothetical protein